MKTNQKKSKIPSDPLLTRLKRLLWMMLAGAVSGLILVITVPPVSMSTFVFVAYLPILIVMLQERRNWWWGGWSLEMVFHLFSIHWVSNNSGTAPNLAFGSYLAMALFLGTRASIPFFLAGLVARKRSTLHGILFLGLFWSAYEWLTSLGELGFPWTISALSVLALPQVLRLVPYGGVWMIATYVWAINVGLLLVIRQKRYRLIAPIVVLAVMPILIPELSSGPTKNVRIGVVQPNIDPVGKWADDPIYTVDRVYDLSKSLLPQNPDFFIWPETAIPFYLQAREGHRVRVQQLIDSLGIPVISGAQHYERVTDTVRTYNAVFVLQSSQAGGIDPGFYAKRWLVPIGERIPFQWLFPSLHGIDLGQAEFSVGPRLDPLSVPLKGGAVKVGTPVCYESIFPQMARMFATRGVQVLANVTNDGWYEHAWEKPQHAELFRLRALETGIPLVRSANTGISGWIDSHGRWQDRMPEREAVAKVYDIPVPIRAPVRIGTLPWWAILCLVGSLLLIFVPKSKITGTD